MATLGKIGNVVGLLAYPRRNARVKDFGESPQVNNYPF